MITEIIEVLLHHLYKCFRLVKQLKHNQPQTNSTDSVLLLAITNQYLSLQLADSMG